MGCLEADSTGSWGAGEDLATGPWRDCQAKMGESIDSVTGAMETQYLVCLVVIACQGSVSSHVHR